MRITLNPTESSRKFNQGNVGFSIQFFGGMTEQTQGSLISKISIGRTCDSPQVFASKKQKHMSTQTPVPVCLQQLYL